MPTDKPRVAQINGMTFKYPTSPILSQPEITPDDMICSIDERSEFCIANTPRFCECLQILEVPVNKTIELVIIDEGESLQPERKESIHYFRHFLFSQVLEEMIPILFTFTDIR